jgi:hypothetical protein
MMEKYKMNLRDTKFAFAAFLVFSMLVQTSMGFGVSGAIFREEVSPGQELVHEITVSNGEKASALNMTAEVYGFTKSLGGVNIELSPENDTGPFTARPFLSVEPKSFRLGPGERKTLLLTGIVPEDVGPGGKYALVAIKTEPKIIGSVSVSTAIHSIVLLTIKDTELIQTGNITDLDASRSDEGVAVDLIFENTGNVHYKPFVETVLKSEDGEVLAEEAIKQGRPSFILPTNSYLFKMDLVPEAGLTPGNYTVEAKVTKEDGTVLDSEETTFKV